MTYLAEADQVGWDDVLPVTWTHPFDTTRIFGGSVMCGGRRDPTAELALTAVAGKHLAAKGLV